MYLNCYSPHRSNELVSFVEAVTIAEYVILGRVSVRAYERAPAQFRWSLDAGQAQRDGSKVNERNHAVGASARFGWRPLGKTLRIPDQRRNTRRRLEQERLAPGHTGSVIGHEGDDRRVCQAVRLQLARISPASPSAKLMLLA